MQHRIVVSLNRIYKSCGYVQNSYVVADVYVEKLWAHADTSTQITRDQVSVRVTVTVMVRLLGSAGRSWVLGSGGWSWVLGLVGRLWVLG